MDDSKFPIKYIIIIIILIIIFGLGYFYRGQLFNLSGQKPAEQNLPNVSELDLQKQIAEIIKTGDFNKCQEVQDATYRTACINNIALNSANKNLDISFCQKLDDKLASIQDCERNIIFEKSTQKGDVNFCSETKNQDLQKECIINFWTKAAVNGKIELCDNISDEQAKNQCHDYYLLNKEFLNNVSGFVCSKFLIPEVKNDCQTYQSQISKKVPVYSFCPELKSALFINYCLNLR